MSMARVTHYRTPIPEPGSGIRFLGPTDPDWYRDHSNLALLLRYLEEHGLMDEPASYVAEKPWKFERDFQNALAWHTKETAE